MSNVSDQMVTAASPVPEDQSAVEQLRELMSSRRSVRGYLPDPVPVEVISEIIDTACLSPSSMNTQPWHFYVVTGEPLDRIRTETTQQMIAGAPVKRDLDMVEEYKGVYRQRQVDIAVQLFTSMGIERHDKERRMDWTLRGFRQFDAPASIVVTYDRALDEIAPITHFDLGAVTHGLVLAAWAMGLGTVINGQGAMQSDIVRKHAGVADEHAIFTCVALGYPDESFVANAVRSTRVPASANAVFRGF